MKYPTLYRTIQVDGLSIFYREAATGGAFCRHTTRIHGCASARMLCRWSKLMEVLDCGNGYQEKE